MNHAYQSNDFLRKLHERSTYSQAGQDLFVIDMLSNKNNGFYLEIGASHPFESSNTFLLESCLNWNGISIEIDEATANTFNLFRKNKAINCDATNVDFITLFRENAVPKVLDYLSLDIEPAENTFKALLSLPMNDYRFAVITYEHDRYVSGDKFMNLSRDYLTMLGYTLVFPNVKFRGRDFEDWYIDSNLIESPTWYGKNIFEKEYYEFFK